MQKEADYLVDEQNKLELQCSDFRERLKKKEEDLREIKMSLNSQIHQVDETYKERMEKLEEEVETLTQELEKTKTSYKHELKDRRSAEEAKEEVLDRIERQRNFVKELQEELIEEQSKKADLEDKLITTEQQLVAAKSSWANSELEREQMYNKVMELEENLEALKINRGRRCSTAVTTKTNSSKASNPLHS